MKPKVRKVKAPVLQGSSGQAQNKPLVIPCRLTIPNDVDLLELYRKFTEGKFTVLKKSDLYPNDDGETSRFFLELYIWSDQGGKQE